MNAGILLFAALAVRNPFWPIGYEGELEVISADPKVEIQSAAAAEGEEIATAATAATAAALAATSQKTSARRWQEARKTLRISGTTVVTDQQTFRQRQSVIINGYTYGDGDLISVNHEGHRFTWRIRGLTEGATLKLERVRVKELEEDIKEEE